MHTLEHIPSPAYVHTCTCAHTADTSPKHKRMRRSFLEVRSEMHARKVQSQREMSMHGDK